MYKVSGFAVNPLIDLPHQHRLIQNQNLTLALTQPSEANFATIQTMQDARQYAPATLRNREAILEFLLQNLPPVGNILEISSGTGEHAVYFAPHLQPRKWIPSDPNPIAISSITAWQQHQPSPNLVEPLAINVMETEWGDRLLNQNIQAIVNINMIHIAPWAACLGLMSGANKILPVGGILYLYGSYKRNGKHTAPSNADFDASLRDQNPAWGVRDLEEVIGVAVAQNLVLHKVQPMPANNLSVIFQKIRDEKPYIDLN